MKKQKTFKQKQRITGILSVLLMFGPLVGFSIAALSSGALVEHKVTLCATVFIVLILSALAALRKVAMRSRIYVLLIGLYLALGYLLPALVVIGACQLIDEVVVSPLHDKYKRLAEIKEAMNGD